MPARSESRCLDRRALLRGALMSAMAVRSGGLAAQTDSPASVAAAASVQFALEEVIVGFTAMSSLAVRLTVGATGNLVRQIERGAPFEILIGADDAYPRRLAVTGLAIDEGHIYARGRLALFVPHGSPLPLDPSLAGLPDVLAAHRDARFAIANPEIAPYGRAAVEALRSLSRWQDVAPRLVTGENVAQAAQFATTGNAVGGLVSLSLALTPALAARGRHVLIQESLHAPILHRMVLMRGAGAAARRFYGYMQQPAARAVLARNGLEPPVS